MGLSINAFLFGIKSSSCLHLEILRRVLRSSYKAKIWDIQEVKKNLHGKVNEKFLNAL